MQDYRLNSCLTFGCPDGQKLKIHQQDLFNIMQPNNIFSNILDAKV